MNEGEERIRKELIELCSEQLERWQKEIEKVSIFSKEYITYHHRWLYYFALRGRLYSEECGLVGNKKRSKEEFLASPL